MPQYFSPGVYVEEIDAGPRPIQGVSTSIAGMVGVTVRGPTDGKPKLVTSFNEYQRVFGGFLPEQDARLRALLGDPANIDGGAWWMFPFAVKGFFDNGGQQLYVKRVVAAGAVGMRGAVPSSAPFHGGLISEVVRTANRGETEIALEHLVGVTSASAQLTIFYRDPASPASQVADVAAYDSSRGTVTLAGVGGLNQRLIAGRDLVQIGSIDPTQTLGVTASALGGWGDGVQVRVRPNVTTLGVFADPSEGDTFSTDVRQQATPPSTTVTVRAVPGLSALVGLAPANGLFVQIGSDLLRVDAVAVAGNDIQLTLRASIPRQLNPGDVVRRVRVANPGAPRPTLRVAGANRLYPNAVVEIDTGTAKTFHEVSRVENDVVTFAQNPPADLFETAKIHLVEAEVLASFTDETGNVIDESFPNLHLATSDPQGFEGRINGRSQLITARQVANLASAASFRLPVPPAPANGSTVQLGGGQDNYDALRIADFVGVDGGSGKRTGIQALEDIDEVAICAVPGMWSGTVQSALIQHCEQLKDRFAVLDPPDGLDIEGIQTFRAPLDTRYAALYYPWLVTRDSSTDKDTHVPPSGHMAGIYARTDQERGVHKAPANVQIRGINLRDGLAADITKRHQGLLNPKGINALRFFPTFGQRVWGARTLSSDSTWKYINVRRLFIFVEESIDEGTQWVVFEPNDEPLWALVRQTITNFLIGVWSTGALAGLTPDEAFFVRCDRTTMTQDDIDNGRLICQIGIAPVYPAEFVIFRIQQKTRELQPA